MNRAPSNLEAATDILLSSAFDFSLPLEIRLEKLGAATDAVDGMLLGGWPDSPRRAATSIRALAATACTPALESVMRGEMSHKRARDTSDNMRDIACFLAKTGIAKDDNPNIVGQVAEFSVLGLSWWGIANGVFSEKSYLFPATTAQDVGSLDGARNGIDLSGKIDTRKIKIQVKNSERKARHIYGEGIRVMSPQQVAPNAEHGGRAIVSELERNRTEQLLSYCSRLRSILLPPPATKVVFDASVYKGLPANPPGKKSFKRR